MTMLTKVRSGHLILIDTDSRRRAAACYSLNLTGVFVDPVEDLSELEAAWPDDAVILIHDDGQAVSALAQRMLEAKVWLPFVAYAASPTAKMIVDAMSAGATDYAEWPLSVACCRFDGHRDKVFFRTGGPAWNEGSIRASLSLRR